MNYNPHLPEVRANLYVHYAYLRERRRSFGSTPFRHGPSVAMRMLSTY